MAGLIEYMNAGGREPVQSWFTGDWGSTIRKAGDTASNMIMSPLFQGGAALASGEGFSGMQRGIQASSMYADQQREQQKRQRFDSLLRNPDFTKGSDPRVVQYSQAAQDPSLIAKQGLPEEVRAAEMHPYDIAVKRAQASKLQREAAEGAGGFGREIRPYQTADGKIWGVQAGANGDRLMHDLSNPTSPPIYVPRGRHLPPGAAPAPAGSAPMGGLFDDRKYSGTPSPPNAAAPSGAPLEERPRTIHDPMPPPPGQTRSPVEPQQRPSGGLFDDNQYSQPTTASPPIAAPPQQAIAQAPTAQPPAGRQMPTALTPHRGVKQVGKHLVDIGSGRIVGDVEDSIRGGKYVEEDAKAAVADVKSRNEAIQVSRSKLPRLEIMAELIDRPEVYQGTGGNAVLELKKAAQAFGIDVGDVSGSEAVRMISNQFALALRNPAGGEGMPGALSDRDLSFLTASTPGLANTRQGNQLMARVMIDLEKHKMRENAEAARYLQQRRSTGGLAEHMQAWADRNPALSKPVRDRISGLTGVQYGAKSGPAAGPSTPKQFNGRLNEPTPAAEAQGAGAGRYASSGLGGAIPTIRGDADYQSLPQGSQYYAPDGSLRRKN